METQELIVDREEAAKMFRKYREHKYHQTPIDAEIERIYSAIAKGKVIVRALESIRSAGLDESRLPKLAIARADAKTLFLEANSTGYARMADVQWVDGRTAATRHVEFEAGTFPDIRVGRHSAIVPHIPPDIRPKRGIQNYHVLWEAVWTPEPPRDPMLLRRLSKAGDMWLVCGAWDLTDIERGVLADRLRVRQ